MYLHKFFAIQYQMLLHVEQPAFGQASSRTDFKGIALYTVELALTCATRC